VDALREVGAAEQVTTLADRAAHVPLDHAADVIWLLEVLREVGAAEQATMLAGRAADDLAAEVFTVAFAQRRRYDLARECARPWLYGIATNLAGTYRRREQRRYRALARADARGVAPSDEDLVADRVSAAAAGRALAAALAGLGSGDRDVLLLVAIAGLGNQEVALSLGIPYGTVRSRLSRSRARLRDGTCPP
jgi:RNA polymerase sigma factor (sigma-70 family)